MKRSELIQFLLENRGYLKKGSKYLADKFNIAEDFAKDTLKLVKNLNNNTNKIHEVEEVTSKSSNKITKAGTYWVTGCAHAPWHNKKMYDSTINFLQREVDLSGIILAGDIIDANSLSAHDRGNIALPGVTLEWEYKEANKFLDQIELAFDDKNPDYISKYFLYGNHEDRYNRLIRNVDSSKYGRALKSPAEGLKLAERGYNVFTDWKNDSIKIGKYLDINHGEFCNVHTAKKTIDTYRQSTMYFHTHRFQVYMEGQVGGFNMGAGANFDAPVFGYATRAMKTSWTNASALVTLDKDGFYHVQPLHFMNNQLIVNGKKY